MSKRHRKTKNIVTATGEGAVIWDYDPDDYNTMRGRKSKSRHRRQYVKQAYYD